MLKNKEIEKIENLSDRRADQFGDAPETIGWRDWEQQKLRFEMLLNQIEICDDTIILDLGCGFADLLTYIKQIRPNYKDINYFGCEISANILNIAKSNHKLANFLKLNFHNAERLSDRKYDYIFCSGGLNYSLNVEKMDVLENFIKIYIPLARKGIVFNLIADDVDYMEDRLLYYSPSDVIKLISKYSRKYVILKNYPLWEFTCIIGV